MKKHLLFNLFVLLTLSNAALINAASHKPFAASDENCNPQQSSLFCDETPESAKQSDIDMTDVFRVPVLPQEYDDSESENETEPNLRFIAQTSGKYLIGIDQETGCLEIFDQTAPYKSASFRTNLLKNLTHVLINKSIPRTDIIIEPNIVCNKALSFKSLHNPSERYLIHFDGCNKHQILSIDCGNLSIERPDFDRMQNAFFYQPR